MNLTEFKGNKLLSIQSTTSSHPRQHRIWQFLLLFFTLIWANQKLLYDSINISNNWLLRNELNICSDILMEM